MDKQECSQHYSGIGGQAVLEGVMMKNGERYAVAVRKEDGSIVLREDTYRGVLAGTPVRKIPVVRGFFALIDSLALGLKVTDYSASMYDSEEEAETGSAGEKIITGLILIASGPDRGSSPPRGLSGLYHGDQRHEGYPQALPISRRRAQVHQLH